MATTVPRAEERCAQLEQVVREHTVLHEAVSLTAKAFEVHDLFLRDRCLNATETAAAYVEDEIAEQRRRSLRYALGEAQLRLAEFEKTHDVKAVEAELADIQANGDARERAAALREVIQMMADFDHKILQPGAACWAEIRQRLIEVEARWPGQRVATDLGHVPDGYFYPNGARSLPAWYREKLCAAEPGLFEPDDPVRQKIEPMRAQGRVVIWHPQRLRWG